MVSVRYHFTLGLRLLTSDIFFLRCLSNNQSRFKGKLFWSNKKFTLISVIDVVYGYVENSSNRLAIKQSNEYLQFSAELWEMIECEQAILVAIRCKRECLIGPDSRKQPSNVLRQSPFGIFLNLLQFIELMECHKIHKLSSNSSRKHQLHKAKPRRTRTDLCLRAGRFPFRCALSGILCVFWSAKCIHSYFLCLQSKLSD